MRIYSHRTGAAGPEIPARHIDPDQRLRELARLLPLWPHDLEDVSVKGRRRIVALMERALRAERKRGRAGHWAYDLARHAALHRAWVRERDALRDIERSTARANVGSKG